MSLESGISTDVTSLDYDTMKLEEHKWEKEKEIYRNIPDINLPNNYDDLIAHFCNDETRPFFECLIPTIALGLEYVAKRGRDSDFISEDGNELTTTEFNPINDLASWLMMNNPLRDDLNETNSFLKVYRRAIAATIKHEHTAKTNDLSEVHLQLLAEQARKEQEQMEKERVAQLLSYTNSLYKQFLLGDQFTVEANVVYNAVKTCTESLLNNCPEVYPMLKPVINYERKPNLQPEFNPKTFSIFLMSYIRPLNEAQLALFKELMATCVQDYSLNFLKNQRRNVYSKLFISCDIDQAGALSRANVMKVFEGFYDAASVELSVNFRDPATCTFSLA
ncbi:EF-hand calcium-binding domain-containing protein 5 [Cichlidogyrus casuarinus]|uniref:EF-hand calcium-binding domain-containing protein 5 n=1 Tax=Cichlidogyrus casuarinus TaxID=1844966 RepID=A0ABD2PMR8_9PLAT